MKATAPKENGLKKTWRVLEAVMNKMRRPWREQQKTAMIGRLN